MPHERDDAPALVVREAEARRDRLGNLGADAVVIVERPVVTSCPTTRASAACRRRAAAPRCGGLGPPRRRPCTPSRAARRRRRATCSAPSPRRSRSSGQVTPRMPVLRITSKARDGRRAFMVLTHSSRTRSSETLRKVSSVGRMAASVSGSSSISSVATKRAARRTRRPSSEKRSTRIAHRAQDARARGPSGRRTGR